jgi:hypothetical protein
VLTGLIQIPWAIAFKNFPLSAERLAEYQGRPFIAMGYLEGETLKHALRRGVSSKNYIAQSSERFAVRHARHVPGQNSCRERPFQEKLNFALQTSTRLVLRSHASVWKSFSIRQLCECRDDVGRRLFESRSRDRAREAR